MIILILIVVLKFFRKRWDKLRIEVDL